MKSRSLSRSGWWALYIMLPQIVLGAYLAWVPDRFAFTTGQVVVIAHIVLGILSLLPFSLWLASHIREREYPSDRSYRTIVAIGTSIVLATMASFAYLTGVGLVIIPGYSESMHTWHFLFGLGLLVPMLVHLWLSSRIKATLLLFSLTLILVFGSAAFQANAPPPYPDRPSFRYETRPTALYRSAEWCGSCHVEIYNEWRHSTHARALQIPANSKGRDEPSSVVGGLMNASGQQGTEQFQDVDIKMDPNTGRCVECHAPLSYYGDDTTSIFQARVPVSEGVTCSFCHTLRGIQDCSDGGQNPFGDQVLDDPDRTCPHMVSAPETVQPYLGHRSDSPILQQLGDTLLWLRPAMHRRNYMRPILKTSEACSVCHNLTYASWKDSSYNDPDKPVHCQDCHMVREMTGAPVVEPGPLVPGGPIRPQRRSHYFLGGNVQAATAYNDLDMAKRERMVSEKGMKVDFVSMQVEDAHVIAEVRVTNIGVGHVFPVLELMEHWAFLQLVLLDANDVVLATTEVPKDANKRIMKQGKAYFKNVPGFPCTVITGDPREPKDTDTSIHPKKSRTFQLRLPLPATGTADLQAVAWLYHMLDPEPIAQDKRTVDSR